ncbi:hypothetical protein AB0J14_04380 [Micromonospora arborensis]|uniref:hypothetical protein n=1 Tax=Micromonospora arborensis TaxID=2116518 RepID=UPI0033D719BF
MNRLFAALFPVLAGRVDAALLVRSQRSAIERLVRENARLRGRLDRYDRFRRDAHIRLMAGSSSSSRSTSPKEPTRAH